jgi:hypothetical protein
MFLREFLNNPIRLDELNIAQTLDFIKKAHGDQLYGKLPYWTHPRAVAMTGKKIFGGKFNSDAVKVAFLHDVVEDTNIGLDELAKLDFSQQVIEAVGLLTKDKTLGYSQNIERIINSGNPLAMMVKYADNYENFSGDKSSWDPKRAASSQKKYLASLNMLGDKLGVAHHVVEAKKRKRKKVKHAAYGPGPYGGYGYYPGYSGEGGGDGGVGENFADGKNPQDKGDSKRHGVPTKASVSTLRKVAKQGGRKGQLAHWMANMKAGKAKKNESLTEAVIHPSTMDALQDFLPFVMQLLKLDKLPKIKIHKTIETGDQPSFGGYNPDDGTIQLALKDRHPADILRTLAHELIHFKQDQDGKLNDRSGMTGSNEENEANTKAGIIMRHFNKKFPKYLE